MIDVSVESPTGELTRVRKVSPRNTRRGAEQFERDVRNKILNGTWGVEPSPSLGQWAEIFAVDHSEAKRLRPGSIREQRSAFRLYILPILGESIRVDLIRTPHFDRLRRGMAARGLSAKTMNNTLGVLSRAVRFYYERQGLPTPHFDACRVKVPRNPPKFWEREHYARLVTAAEDRGPTDLAILLLMGDCGLRVSEVAALEWTHVRWEPAPVIVIQRSFTAGEFGPTKNGRPRTVPMTDRVLAALRGLPRRLRAPWVFTRVRKGQVIHKTASSIAWTIGHIEHDAGLGPARAHGKLHKLRHTFVTRLAAAGVPARTIMELAGHAHITTTLRYMHVMPGATSAAIDALQAFDQRQPESERQPSDSRDRRSSNSGS